MMFRRFRATILWLAFVLAAMCGKAQSLTDEKLLVDFVQTQLRQQVERYRHGEAPLCSLYCRIIKQEDCVLSSQMGSTKEKRYRFDSRFSVRLIVGDLDSGDYTEGCSSDTLPFFPSELNEQAIAAALDREVSLVYGQTLKKHQKRHLQESLGQPKHRKVFEPPHQDAVFESPRESSISACMEGWSERLNDCSALCNTFENCRNGLARLQYSYVRTYSLGNGGECAAVNSNVSVLTLSMAALADDGMLVTCAKTLSADYPNDLPQESEIFPEMHQLYARLCRTAEAPAAEPSVCPVMMSGAAASAVLYASVTQLTNAVSSALSFSSDDYGFVAFARFPQPESELLAALKKEIARQGKPYGYWIRDVLFMPDGEIVPQEVYRVYADDVNGTGKLVRGLRFADLTMVCPAVQLCGNIPEMSVVPSITDGVPKRCTAPSVLLTVMATDVARCEEMPALLSPLIAKDDGHKSSGQFSEICSSIMQEEMTAFFEDTALRVYPPAYDLDFLVTDANLYQVNSIMGSTVLLSEMPKRSVETQVRVGDDQLNNENFAPKDWSKTAFDLPLDDNGSNLRRALHESAGQAYRQALADYAEKQHTLAQWPYDRVSSLPPDRSRAFKNEFFDSTATGQWTLELLQDFANGISAAFARDTMALKTMLGCGVNVYAYKANAYYLSAQGIRYEQPFQLVCVQIYAQAAADDGTPLRDCSHFFFSDISELSDVSNLADSALAMMRLLSELRSAPLVKDFYDGPAIVSGPAAAVLIKQAFLERTPSLIAVRPLIQTDGANYNYLGNMIDQKVVSPSLDIYSGYGCGKRCAAELIGRYTTDADGVAAEERMEVIEHGRLYTLLSNRTPTAAVRFSNGHQRLTLSAGRLVAACGAGILELKCRSQVDDSEMYKKARKLARQAGWHYIYEIVKMPDCLGNERFETTPVYAYKVKLSDGEKTLVRIHRTENIDMHLFGRVVAASDETAVANRLSPGQSKCSGIPEMPFAGFPVTIIAPKSLLFSSLKIQ
jgi:hypothetical protein